MSVLAGTSGWQYRDWRDTFYPRNVPQRRWLEYYASQFRSFGVMGDPGFAGGRR